MIDIAAILMMSAEIGYSRSSQNKGTLKRRLWRHNFCPWCYQQNFKSRLKLYCRFGHVTKVWCFYERSYHKLNFIGIWPEKSIFLRGALGSSSIIYDWHLRMSLKFDTSVEKDLKLKVRKFWGQIPTFAVVTGGKNERGPLCQRRHPEQC